MLTDIKVRQAAIPPIKPYKLYDRDGLFILVSPNGSKWWRFKYRWEDKEKLLSFGVYPDVSLATARSKRDEARQLIAAGQDPSQLKREQREARIIDRSNCFKTVAEEWLAVRAKIISEQSVGNISRRLNKYVFPEIGDIPVSRIDAPAVLLVVRKLEATETYETARRVRQDIGQILRFANATGRKASDVTSNLRGVTVPVRVTHRPAITVPHELPKLLRSIWSYEGDKTIKAALKLLPLVMLRPSELSNAEWSEFDLDAATWLIPAERMKMKGAHIVPLSTQAVTILAAMREISGNYQYVFPNRRRCVAPMNRTSLPNALERIGFKGKQTAHGFRATAKTILEEQLGFDPRFTEMSLAHAVKDPNGNAYNRSAFLSQRASMMQVWADYLDGLRTKTV